MKKVTTLTFSGAPVFRICEKGARAAPSKIQILYAGVNQIGLTTEGQIQLWE